MQKLRLPHCSRRIRGAIARVRSDIFYATSPRYLMSMGQIGQKQKAKRASCFPDGAGQATANRRMIDVAASPLE